MPEPAEQPYRTGEPLTLTTTEGGFPTRRGVEFQAMANGQQAQVKFAGDIYTVNLDQLSRQEPAKPPNFLPDGWFKVKQPPKPPSSEDLAATLSERRAALARAQDRAKEAAEQQAAARLVSQRADREVTDARTTLATLDAHERADQRAFEEAISLGKPLPVRSNGKDRSYIVQRVTAAEAAQQRFDRELAESTAALSDSLSAVRKSAALVVAAMLEKETLNLAAAEARAALLRAELTAISGLWLSAEIGPLKVSPATANCLAAPIAWSDQPLVRAGGGWTKAWQGLFDRLCQDATADWILERD